MGMVKLLRRVEHNGYMFMLLTGPMMSVQASGDASPEASEVIDGN